MSLALDHLVVAARTLEEGARWLEARTGVPTLPGGRHGLMGTHNRLLALGGGAYLEVIAVDPEAPAPARARWFGLDDPATRRRLEAGPALVHWVARTDDIGAARAGHPGLVGEVLALSRGEYRWRIGVAPDGSLPAAGAFPTLIQWEGDRHPASSLPDSGCRLHRLTVRAPGAAGLLATLRSLGLGEDAPVRYVPAEGFGLSAELRSPRGVVLLPETVAAE
jgi:hypothetical protein